MRHLIFLEQQNLTERNFIGRLSAAAMAIERGAMDEGCGEPVAITHGDLLTVALSEVVAELTAAMVWPAMNSAHEGYGVLLEEVDELWLHVKTKQKNRDLGAMRKEAIQVAAMAVRFAIEICNEERGRK